MTAIYMGACAKMMSSMSMSCNNKRKQDITRLEYPTVLDFLKEKEDDQAFVKQILSNLPKELMQRYFEEREATNYEPPDVVDADALLNVGNLQMKAYNANEPVVEAKHDYTLAKTHDVFGK